MDRILRALNHPIRRRILQALSHGPASASTLAKTFEEELGMVSYHLNQVLAKECEVVELVDAIPRRGALEKIYGLDAGAWMQLSSVFELAGGGIDCLPLEVDSATWQEICAAREEFQERVSAAVSAGQGRPPAASTDEVRQAFVGVAAFTAPASA